MQVRSKKYMSRLTFLTTIFSLMAIVHCAVMLISMLVDQKSNNTPPLFVKLFFCRVHVEESADGRGRDLVFRSLQVDDEGEYSCEAIIDGINEKKIFYLKVIGKKNHIMPSLISKNNKTILDRKTNSIYEAGNVRVFFNTYFRSM